MSTSNPSLRPVAVPGLRRRAVLYLRQSTYREESISLELQEAAGRRYCEERGYDIIAVEEDPGISGRTFDRPAVKRVMAMVESRQVDAVIVWKWSRLSRNMRDFAIAVDKIESIGGSIESATEPVDTSNASGRFARGMLAQFAEFESARIGDGWKEVKQRRANQGLPHGGPIPFGYNLVDGQYIIDPVAGPQLAAAYRSYIAGNSFDQIADELTARGAKRRRSSEPWPTEVVIKMLDSGIGAGWLRLHGEPYRGVHEPVITETEWIDYQAARGRRRASGDRRAPQSRSVLTGLLYCECGGKLYSASERHSWSQDYVRCKSARQSGHRQTRFNESEILEYVMAWLQEHVAAIDEAAQSTNSTALVRSVPNPSTSLKSRLAEVNRKIDRLTALLVDETIDRSDYQRSIAPLKAERERIENELLQADVAARKPARVLLPTLHTVWPDATPAEKRELLRLLIDRITIGATRPLNVLEIKAK